MTDDWFRSAEWDDAAQEDFEAHLRRARSKRPQYLRIKAIALHDAGKATAARSLLLRVLEDPGMFGQFEHPFAHELLGDIAAQEADWRGAEAHYRKVLENSLGLGPTTGTVEISLADVLSRDSESARHAEALSLLEAYLRRDGIQWQSALFRWHIVRIRLAAFEGDQATEQASAREALRLAGLGSQFPRHGDVGRVRTTPEALRELHRIVDESRPD